MGVWRGCVLTLGGARAHDFATKTEIKAMQRTLQALTALALLLSGGLWAKQTQAVEAQPVAKSGGTVWPFGGNPSNCACAFCTGKARIGAVQQDHRLL